jgi:hypothetical protein
MWHKALYIVSLVVVPAAWGLAVDFAVERIHRWRRRRGTA